MLEEGKLGDLFVVPNMSPVYFHYEICRVGLNAILYFVVFHTNVQVVGLV